MSATDSAQRAPLVSLVLVTVAMFGFVTAALADGAGAYRGQPGKFETVQDLIDSEDYPGAVAALERLLVEAPDDADTLNLLGFSNRKLGRFDVALDYYRRALAIDPGHRGALEYLGELYLQTDRPELAEQQLERLEALCTLCSERRKLRRAIKAWRDSHG